MKRIICGLLSLVLVLFSTACDSAEDVAEITKTPIVVTMQSGTALLAAEDYCREKGYEHEKLYNLTDCAVAVENGKYDYLICGEYDEYRLADFKLKYVEDCGYKSQYSLCFRSDSAELCAQLNASLSELTDNSTLDKICESYKGGEKYECADTVGNPLYIMFPEGMDGYSAFDEDGEARGIEVDIVTAICNNLGYTPVFVNGEYDESFDALLNGEVDVVMGVDFINSALGEDFTLSDPYFTIAYKVYGADI